MIDEDIPALVPAAVIITATFLAFAHVIVYQAVNWTVMQQDTSLYNVADWCWEKIGGEYKGQQVTVPAGYCATIKDGQGNKILETGQECGNRKTVSLPLIVKGGLGSIEVRT